MFGVSSPCRFPSVVRLFSISLSSHLGFIVALRCRGVMLHLTAPMLCHGNSSSYSSKRGSHPSSAVYLNCFISFHLASTFACCEQLINF